MSITIQLRRDTAANWTSQDPVLNSGEAGLETDSGKLKIGDGETAWTSLAYFAGSGGGGSGTVTDVSVASANGFAGTVASPTTTPAVTVETTVTGLLKGNGTAVSAAVAGTDYDAAGAAATAQSNAETFATAAVATETSRAETAEGLLAPLASPALTGSPTAPTKTALTDNTDIATTAYADSAVAVETARAETAEGLALQKASNLSDLASASTARTNLGLGSAATHASTDFDAAGAAATAQTAAEAASIPLADLGAANGAAQLNSSGFVSLGQGGTGKGTAQAAMNALAGAQTSGEYLRGNGTNVVMAAIPVADVPGVNGVTVSGTPSTGQVITATSSSAADWATPAGSPAYQFTPEAYGALGNGNVILDAAITATLHVLTSSTAGFTAGDVGKSILVTGAGAAGVDLFTTISAYTNSTTVTLTAAAGTTVTASGAIYGTDDTTAIQNALNAAVTYGEASVTRYCEVIFGSKIYVVAGPCVGLSGAGTGNSQIVLPYIDSGAAGRKLVIAFKGVQDPGSPVFNSTASGSHETTPAFFGTVLACPRLDGTNNGTYGPSFVVGGPYDISHASDFTNLNVIIDGINVAVPHEPTYGGFDLVVCAAASVVKASCQAMAINASGGAWPQIASYGPVTNQFAYGLRMPCNANNDFSHIGLFTAFGMGNGVYLSNASSFDELRLQHCYAPVVFGTLGSDMADGISGRYIFIRKCNSTLTSEGTTHAIRAYIDCVDTDPSGAAISDSGNTISGEIGFRYPSEPSYGGISVTGAAECRIIDKRQFVGPLASPHAAPASTAAWANTYYRDAWITLSATTITGVTISNGLQSVAQNGLAGSPATYSFLLPSGQSYTPTYTGTLTHTVTIL